MNNMVKNYVNHIVFVIDRSGSMNDLSDTVVNVFDNQIKYLATRSKELNQETRVSVYLFDDVTENLIYDMDVMRLPSLKQHYQVRGYTALIDATLKSIDDLQKTPELYGDHSFLIYVLTDGNENRSSHSSETLLKKIQSLHENWTLGVLVPDASSVMTAKQFGFPANNISVWSTTVKGLTEVGKTLQTATENFFVGRSKGIRGTKSLFAVDASALSKSAVVNNLDELKADQYQIFPVHRQEVIKPYVESWTQKPYRVGSAYYALTKPETIQNYKQICIQNKRNGKIYTGPVARKLLNLPDVEVKVTPADFGEWNIFAQSTSVNRKLVPGTQLIVLK